MTIDNVNFYSRITIMVNLSHSNDASFKYNTPYLVTPIFKLLKVLNEYLPSSFNNGKNNSFLVILSSLTSITSFFSFILHLISFKIINYLI